jgi:tRNA threonylcarbamoyladenosine biosynthesis protein TsaE
MKLEDERATERLGAALATALGPLCRPSTVIYLQGELGAGKTTLARGFLRAAGVSDIVRSPSYTLVEPYDTSLGPVLHADLYRLKTPHELLQLGLEELPPGGFLLVEWPERGAPLLAAPDLTVTLEHAAPGRAARLGGNPELAAAIAAISLK